MRYWQATLMIGGATQTLGVEGDTAPDAFRCLGQRVGFAQLAGARIFIREIIPPDERKPGEPREAASDPAA